MHPFLRILIVVFPIFFLLLNVYLLLPCCFSCLERGCLLAMILPFVSWFLGNVCYDWLNVSQIEIGNKAVLITGCDSGFGYLLAKKLADLGFYVYASVLLPDGQGAKDLASAHSSNLEILQMNVTSQSDVESAFSYVSAQPRPLWAVVNNAGITLNAPWDWGADVDDFRHILDVNTFGMIRVSKNAAPLLRRTGGRIVNVSSAASRIAAPGLSHYTISKYAVRALTDSIRRDGIGGKQDNLRAIAIEPSFYRTSIVDKEAIKIGRARIRSQTPSSILEAYSGVNVETINEKMLNLMDALMNENIHQVVEAMVKAVLLKHPKDVYKCSGLLSGCFLWISSQLPDVMVDFGMCVLAKV